MSETHLTDQTNQRWEQLLRYRYIELISLWEGRLTTRKLCDTFGIGRQQANKDLSNYRRAHALSQGVAHTRRNMPGEVVFVQPKNFEAIRKADLRDIAWACVCGGGYVGVLV